MPYPKGIHHSPEVQARYLSETRAKLAAFDRLRADGVLAKAAARQVGRSLSGIAAMRRSVEQLSTSGPSHRGTGNLHIDLGLALLSILRKPDEPLTHEDIAAWCGCSHQHIVRIEQRALRKLRLRITETHGGAEIAEEIAALFGGA